MKIQKNTLHIDDALDPSLVEAIEQTPEPRKERLFDTVIGDNELCIMLCLRIPISPKWLITILGLIGAGVVAVALRWPEIVQILVSGLASPP